MSAPDLSTFSRFYLYYKLVGEGTTATPHQNWVYMDAPGVAIVADAFGNAHLQTTATAAPPPPPPPPAVTYSRPITDYYPAADQQPLYPLPANFANDSVMVFVNGLLQAPDSYTIQGPGATSSGGVVLTQAFTSPWVIIRYSTVG